MVERAVVYMTFVFVLIALLLERPMTYAIAP